MEQEQAVFIGNMVDLAVSRAKMNVCYWYFRGVLGEKSLGDRIVYDWYVKCARSLQIEQYCLSGVVQCK